MINQDLFFISQLIAINRLSALFIMFNINVIDLDQGRELVAIVDIKLPSHCFEAIK